MTILKSLIRTYFLQQSIDVIAQGLFWNLHPAPEADLRGHPRTEAGILAYIQSGDGIKDGIRDTTAAVRAYIRINGVDRTLAIIDNHLRNRKRM